MTLPHLGAELCCGIDRRVDVAPEAFLNSSQGVRNLRERGVSHDEQVNVTISPEISAGGGSEDEGDGDATPERPQRLAEHVDGSGGLHEERSQFWEDRRLSIRLEIDLSSLQRPAKHARASERRELALHRAVGRARLPHDLAQVERLVGVAKQPSEHTKARLAEKHGRHSILVEGLSQSRTHFAYNRTHLRYDFQARSRRNVETRRIRLGKHD